MNKSLLLFPTSAIELRRSQKHEVYFDVFHSECSVYSRFTLKYTNKRAKISSLLEYFTASVVYIRDYPKYTNNKQKFIQTSAVYIQYLSKTSTGRISPTRMFITQKSLRKVPESRLAKRTSYIFFKKKLLNFYKSKKSNIFAVRKIKRTYKI